MILLLKAVPLIPTIRDIKARSVTFCIGGKSRSNQLRKSLQERDISTYYHPSYAILFPKSIPLYVPINKPLKCLKRDEHNKGELLMHMVSIPACILPEKVCIVSLADLLINSRPLLEPGCTTYSGMVSLYQS